MKTKSMESRFDKKFLFKDNSINDDSTHERLKAFIRKELKANDKKWEKQIKERMEVVKFLIKKHDLEIDKHRLDELDNLLQEKV